jgi:hypothetical protein
MNILNDLSGEFFNLFGNDVSFNNIESLNTFGNIIFSRMVQQSLISSVVNNNSISNLMNESLNEVPKYKNVLSEKGKTALKRKKYIKNCCQNDTCAITQDKFKTNELVIVLPCNHGFKEEVLEWLEKENAECPMCRYRLESKEIKNEEYKEEENITDSRNNLLNSLNTINHISNPNSLFNSNMNISIHPFGTNQIFNTIPHSYINNIYSSEEEMINEAILNSLCDVSNN